MVMKPLISATLLSIALTSNGSGSLAANGRQDLRPVPSVPSTADATSAVTEPGEPGEELREEFHQNYPLSLTGRVSLENINGDVQIGSSHFVDCRASADQFHVDIFMNGLRARRL